MGKSPGCRRSRRRQLRKSSTRRDGQGQRTRNSRAGPGGGQTNRGGVAKRVLESRHNMPPCILQHRVFKSLAIVPIVVEAEVCNAHVQIRSSGSRIRHLRVRCACSCVRQSAAVVRQDCTNASCWCTHPPCCTSDALSITSTVGWLCMHRRVQKHMKARQAGRRLGRKGAPSAWGRACCFHPARTSSSPGFRCTC